MSRPPVLTLALVLAAVAAHALGASHWLELDLSRIGREPWLALSGHLGHFSWSHLFWDCVAVALLGAIVERRSRGLFVSVCVVSALAISWAVIAGHTGVRTYRGLSGVATALFMCAAVLKWREWSALVRIAVGAFVLKTAYEAATGGAVFAATDASGMTPVPLAHVIGAGVGAALACGSGILAAFDEKRSVDAC